MTEATGVGDEDEGGARPAGGVAAAAGGVLFQSENHRGGTSLQPGVCPTPKRATTTRPSPTTPRLIRLDPEIGAPAYYSRGQAYAGNKGEHDPGHRRLHRGRPQPDPQHAARLLQPGPGLPPGRATTTRPSPTSPRPSGSTPKEAAAYNERGLSHAETGDDDQAIADFVSEAVRLDPRDARAYNNRSNFYATKGDYDRTIAAFNEAIRVEPKWAGVYTKRPCINYFQE